MFQVDLGIRRMFMPQCKHLTLCNFQDITCTESVCDKIQDYTLLYFFMSEGHLFFFQHLIRRHCQLHATFRKADCIRTCGNSQRTLRKIWSNCAGTHSGHGVDSSEGGEPIQQVMPWQRWPRYERSSRQLSSCISAHTSWKKNWGEHWNAMPFLAWLLMNTKTFLLIKA